MCGIIGAVTHTPVNQLLYDGLLLLQQRGQDAAGIVNSEGPVFHMYKGAGYVRDVFRTRNMRELSGNAGIGHCRYPTAGSAWSDLESQPFYVNSPFGITRDSTPTRSSPRSPACIGAAAARTRSSR